MLGKLFESTCIESRVESLENSVEIFSFLSIFHLEIKDEDKKKNNNPHHKRGEITNIVSAITNPVNNPPGIESKFSFNIRNRSGLLAIVPKSIDKIRYSITNSI